MMIHLKPCYSGKVKLVGLALAAACGAAQAGPLDPAVAKQIDEVVARVGRDRLAGAVVLVARNGETVFRKAYGWADVDKRQPMDAAVQMPIGSVTKQFTAAAILQLRDAGKLSLDDDITKWLPDFDTRGNKVPLRRLLDHTSGIVGITEMPEFGILVNNPRFPRDSGYALIKRYPFQFPTGEAQIYNNSAFWLLGLIIEKASGTTYENYIEQKLFEPLGMKHSMYCNSAENIPRRAHGYQVQNGQTRRAPMNVHTWPFSAGSICSTAGDLITWIKALHGGKVLSPASYTEMTTPSKLNDGSPLWYGMGIGVGTDTRGLKYIGHGGAIGGFLAETMWYPDVQMAVVVLLNSNGNLDPGAVAGDLAAEVMSAKTPAEVLFTGDAAPLVGTYKGPSRGRDMIAAVAQAPTGITISINGGPARPVQWVEGLTFRTGGTNWTFRRGSGNTGPATELRSQSGGGYYILKRQ